VNPTWRLVAPADEVGVSLAFSALALLFAGGRSTPCRA
jgi:hypothetical protein